MAMGGCLSKICGSRGPDEPVPPPGRRPIVGMAPHLAHGLPRNAFWQMRPVRRGERDDSRAAPHSTVVATSSASILPTAQPSPPAASSRAMQSRRLAGSMAELRVPRAQLAHAGRDAKSREDPANERRHSWPPASAPLVRTPNSESLGRTLADSKAREARWFDHAHRDDTEEALFERLMAQGEGATKASVAALQSVPGRSRSPSPTGSGRAAPSATDLLPGAMSERTGGDDSTGERAARGFMAMMTSAPGALLDTLGGTGSDDLLAFALYARFQEAPVRQGIYGRLLRVALTEAQLRSALGTLCRLLLIGGGTDAFRETLPRLLKELVLAALETRDAAKVAAAVRVVASIEAGLDGPMSDDD